MESGSTECCCACWEVVAVVCSCWCCCCELLLLCVLLLCVLLLFKRAEMSFAVVEALIDEVARSARVLTGNYAPSLAAFHTLSLLPSSSLSAFIFPCCVLCLADVFCTFSLNFCRLLQLNKCAARKENSFHSISRHAHTHTHTQTYIYMCVCKNCCWLVESFRPRVVLLVNLQF